MKIGIIGDIHWGIKSDSSEFHESHEALFSWISDEFLNRDVKDVIFLGDYFNNRNEINVKTLNIAKRTMQTFSKLFNSYLIKGNHDSYLKSNTDVSSLHIFDGLNNIHVVSEPTLLEYNDKTILLVPWVTDEQELYSKLKGHTYDFIMGHFEFKGGQVTQFQTNTQHGMSPDDMRRYLKKGGKLYSGHYHLKRWLGNDIFYMGTPMHLSWADAGEEKSIYVLDLDTGSLEAIDNKISPKFESVKVSELKKNNKFEYHNNYVKLVVDMPLDELKIQQLADIIRSQDPRSFTIMDYSQQCITVDPDDVAKIKDPALLIKEYLEALEYPDGISKDDIIKLSEYYYREALTQ